MTKLLDKALEAVRGLPPASQDEIARAMLSLARMDGGEAEEIDPEHLPDVLEGLAEASRGEFATDEEVAAAFRSFKR
jgi:predicted transcriptional regulator